jgi:RNA polymerase sigma-B factor
MSTVTPTDPGTCEDLRVQEEQAVAGETATDQSGESSRTRGDRNSSEVMLAELATLEAGSPEFVRLRARIIEDLLPLATHLAARFRNRGEPFDDLAQVANLALIKAVDGFDPERGVSFSSYAVPFIAGELKRHFRDKTWHVRVPRRLQELSLQINRATDELTQRLGRSPTVADLAKHLEIGEEETIEALEAAGAYHSLSLDAPAGGEDGASTLVDLIGTEDTDLAEVDARVALPPLLATLPSREQKILAMRFYGNLTQSQIAAEMGISQMHVSRLITKALASLRHQLLED